MTSKKCVHRELRRAKTGGWFCVEPDCDFDLAEPQQVETAPEPAGLRAALEKVASGMDGKRVLTAAELISIAVYALRAAPETPAPPERQSFTDALLRAGLTEDHADIAWAVAFAPRHRIGYECPKCNMWIVLGDSICRVDQTVHPHPSAVKAPVTHSFDANGSPV